MITKRAVSSDIMKTKTAAAGGGDMDWIRSEIRDCLERGWRESAMSCVIGALESAVMLRDMKLADEIINIMYEEGLYEDNRK